MDVNFSIGIFKKRWQFPNDLNFVNQDLQSPHFSISFNLLPFWYKTKFFTKEFSSNLILFFPEIEWKSFETSESFHKVQFLWEEKIPKIATKKKYASFFFHSKLWIFKGKVNMVSHGQCTQNNFFFLSKLFHIWFFKVQKCR